MGGQHRFRNHRFPTIPKPAPVQQVILNLIVNAVEAMNGASDGTRELLVSSRKADPGGVLVGVRDSGPGLAPETLDHVFEAFYTTKPSGLGMGLSICRSIIDAHGGRLWAAANEPRGAVFSVHVARIGKGAHESSSGTPLIAFWRGKSQTRGDRAPIASHDLARWYPVTKGYCRALVRGSFFNDLPIGRRDRQRDDFCPMPYKHNASRRHRIPKMKFQVTNWPDYEAGLRKRGSLTLWLTPEALAMWHAPRRQTGFTGCEGYESAEQDRLPLSR